MRLLTMVATISLCAAMAVAQDRPATFPGTELLTADKPLDVLMVEGIDRFCLKEIEQARERRESLWKRDFSSAEAYDKSMAPYREKFRTIIGVVDQRVPATRFEYIEHAPLVTNEFYTVRPVRWAVLPGMTAEGLILDPVGKPHGVVIAIPDSRWSPAEFCGAIHEHLKVVSDLPHLLASNGFRVVIPTLISRDDEFAGNPEIAMTNQTNREWVYRSAFEVGRHVLGYEVQKVLAAVDLLQADKVSSSLPIGVAGLGDGGQIALYSAAVDPRIAAVLVSGYFRPREGVWQEPIDRNVWNLLAEFGDAEIAGMIAPRPLVLEACAIPETDGPLPIREGRRGGAAPGQIKTADLAAVQSEFKRVQPIYEKLGVANKIQLVNNRADGRGIPGSGLATEAFAKSLGVTKFTEHVRTATKEPPYTIDAVAVQKRQVAEAIEFTQKTLRKSYKTRDKLFAQADRSSLDKYVATSEKLREHVYQELIGKLPDPTMAPNPRTRKVLDEKEFTGYEVVLDTYPDVIAAGILLWPTDIKPGEKRPVVVCQHGLEGVPMDTITGPGSPGYGPYKSFSAELAKRGFIVYAPQNPYRGRDAFRTLQRKSNPLGRSLFTYIVPQHLVTLRWLASLPNVDKDRLAFYGLSYGGKTAVRVPPLLPSKDSDPGYCLSICSADYNEWVFKLCVHQRIRDLRMEHGQRRELCRAVDADDTASIHGRTRPRRRRGPRRMGRLRVRQGAASLQQTGNWRSNRNRILQRPAHDQRTGNLRLPSSAPEVAQEVVIDAPM
jgi:dienelactone hydrolase